MLSILRGHAGLPDSMLWAELGVKVPEARTLVAHIDLLTERLAQANRTIEQLKVARPAPTDPRAPHSHVCVSCSPDGAEPGPGCVNCRQTGMDQAPCTALGHSRSCPHGCCDGDKARDRAAGGPAAPIAGSGLPARGESLEPNAVRYIDPPATGPTREYHGPALPRRGQAYQVTHHRQGPDRQPPE